MNQTQNVPAVSGRSPALHDAVRPLWQADVLSWLVGTPAPGDRQAPGARQAPGGQLAVMDLGAGTGLGTRAMAALGHRVTAVDTDPGMLAVLEAARTELPPELAARISTAAGSAEHPPWPPAAWMRLPASRRGTGWTPDRPSPSVTAC